MDNIINKIADWLQISVEKAIELYPQLRTEAVWYKITNEVQGILIGFILVCLLGIWFCVSVTGEVEKMSDNARKLFVVLILAIIVTGVLLLALTIFSPFLFPDIVFFNQFIK